MGYKVNVYLVLSSSVAKSKQDFGITSWSGMPCSDACFNQLCV